MIVNNGSHDIILKFIFYYVYSFLLSTVRMLTPRKEDNKKNIDLRRTKEV